LTAAASLALTQHPLTAGTPEPQSARTEPKIWGLEGFGALPPQLEATIAQTQMLERAVSEDAKTWTGYTYDRGSIRNVRVIRYDGPTVILQGDYTFNGGLREWVIAEERGGAVQCLRYQSGRACEPVGRSQWSAQLARPAQMVSAPQQQVQSAPPSPQVHAKSLRRATPAEVRLLTDAIESDSTAWFVNRYDAGSLKNIDVEQTDQTTILSGEYTFNGGSSGWIAAKLVGGRIECIRYWDTGACSAIRGSGIASSTQAVRAATFPALTDQERKIIQCGFVTQMIQPLQLNSSEVSQIFLGKNADQVARLASFYYSENVRVSGIRAREASRRAYDPAADRTLVAYTESVSAEVLAKQRQGRSVILNFMRDVFSGYRC
jgi:hypothetical protein